MIGFKEFLGEAMRKDALNKHLHVLNKRIRRRDPDKHGNDWDWEREKSAAGKHGDLFDRRVFYGSRRLHPSTHKAEDKARVQTNIVKDKDKRDYFYNFNLGKKDANIILSHRAERLRLLGPKKFLNFLLSMTELYKIK